MERGLLAREVEGGLCVCVCVCVRARARARLLSKTVQKRKRSDGEVKKSGSESEHALALHGKAGDENTENARRVSNQRTMDRMDR